MAARSKASVLRRIRDVSNRLTRIFERSHDERRYWEAQLSEERDHRRGMFSRDYGAFTVDSAARLHYASMVLRYLTGDWSPPEASAYFHTRPSAFMAYALFHQFKAEIEAEFPMEEASAFLASHDYAKLVAGDFAE